MAQLSRQSARNQTWVLPFFAFFCDVRMIRAAHAPTEIAALAAGAMHPDGIPSVPELFNSPTPKNPSHCDERPLLRSSNQSNWNDARAFHPQAVFEEVQARSLRAIRELLVHCLQDFARTPFRFPVPNSNESNNLAREIRKMKTRIFQPFQFQNLHPQQGRRTPV